VKPPYLTASGAGSVGNEQWQGITLCTYNWKTPRGVVLKNMRCGNGVPTVPTPNKKEHCTKYFE